MLICRPSLCFSLALLIVPLSCDTSHDDSVQIENQDMRTVTAASGLVLREKPNTTSTKLALIPEGTKVQVLEEKSESEQIGNVTGKWTRINHNGIRGWVFGAYLEQ